MTPLLAARGLVKTYGPLRALDGVDFSADRGAIHALVGPNGSGKSTLLALLAGRARPDGGSVVFDGDEVTDWAPARRARRGVAIKHQIASVFDELTVADNVGVALLGHVHARGLLRRRGDGELDQRRRDLLARFGLDELACVPASDLAHGQRQWLEIAMAAAARPALLLLDEPTAGMSPYERAEIGAILRGLRDESAVVLVEHDLDWVLGLCDHVTVLAQGRVLGEGSPDAIRQDPSVRDAFVTRV
jgi:branched-chain amino acid transport system ATP-binding protein